MPSASGYVDAPIGRHPTRRTAMAVVAGGRPALSDYSVLERYRNTACSRSSCRPGARIRFASTWPICAIRWWAIRSTAGARAQPPMLDPELAVGPAWLSAPGAAGHRAGPDLTRPAASPCTGRCRWPPIWRRSAPFCNRMPMVQDDGYCRPDWTGAPVVRAVSTTRQGGLSAAGVYASLNLAGPCWR